MSDNKVVSDAYFTLEGAKTGQALAAVDAYRNISHNKVKAGYYGRTDFQDIGTRTSTRSDFTQSDYEYFRPGEAEPRTPQEKMSACNQSYSKVGIIRNVVDLMGDFGVQGIEVVHPNKQIQKFFQKWFKTVKGPERSERFLNLFYRMGMIVARRSVAKLTSKYEEYLRSLGGDTMEADTDLPPILKLSNRVVPIRYDFIDPLVLDIVGGALAQFTGKQIYSIKISSQIRSAINSPKNDAERELVNSLPTDIVQKVRNGSMSIPLDQDRIKVFFYKKDDWQQWADPMLFAIWNDVSVLEKMQLADLAALDGIISSVRLWKLGFINAQNMSQSLFPTDVAVSKLADILLNNPGGGAFDIIWGPDIEFQESSTAAYNFLGEAKYAPILNRIYAGLGVPPTLTGSASAGGFTNNFISLKTLVQRLEYGRSVLKSFWDFELDLVRRAMGFRLPAQIRFDRMTLSDDGAEKALLVQLVDRNLISLETVLERFGEFPELEVLRMRREERERKTGVLVDKMGPYAEKQFDLAKTALGRGYLSPKQSGFDIETEDFKKPPFLLQLDSATKIAASKPAPFSAAPNKVGGRPKTSKSPGPKNTRSPKPRTAAQFIETMKWAKSAQEQIAEIITPGLLKQFGRKNVRSLKEDEFILLEQTKFAILTKLQAHSEVTTQVIYDIIQNPLLIDEAYGVLYNQLLAKSKKPTTEDIHLIQSSVYSLLQGDENE
jgi:hypothetical protein